jgi:GGDEF domain-containing protein
MKKATSFTVAIFDLDNSNRSMTAYGHQVGDQVWYPLQWSLGKISGQVISSRDMGARFVVLSDA